MNTILQNEVLYTCNKCNGTGEIDNKICTKCYGQKKLNWIDFVLGRRLKSLKVKASCVIPSGDSNYFKEIISNLSKELCKQIDEEIIERVTLTIKYE